MNSKPRIVEVRDGKETDEIGKELGHAHKLLCRLRHAGATRDDLVAMRIVDLAILGEFIAKVRGVELPPDRAHLGLDFQMVNLDYEPGYPEPLSRFTGPFFAQKVEVITDDRMGIWPCVENGGSFIFGDMKFSVQRPTGTCVQGRSFCSGNLVGLSKGNRHLNMAMATWFSRNHWVDVPFDSKVVDETQKYKAVFFLGTVWWDPAADGFIAPALVSDAGENKIKLEIKIIPAGPWPKNYYVALLVPR